jgi:hypothetical protein
VSADGCMFACCDGNDDTFATREPLAALALELAKRIEQHELTLCRLFGFLTGATTAGAGMYYYVIDEYRVSNQLLTEDIYVGAAHSCLILAI